MDSVAKLISCLQGGSLIAGSTWLSQMQRVPPTAWTRRSASVFLHLMVFGTEAKVLLHFYADVVSQADQAPFTAGPFQVYDQVVPV